MSKQKVHHPDNPVQPHSDEITKVSPIPPSENRGRDNTLSAGEIMRKARESLGLEVSTLSIALKVSENKIEALEANRFDLLPSAVFYRSLAASICKYLNIDAASVLEKLPKNTAPQFEEGAWGINQPFQRRSDVWHFSTVSFLTKPTTWIVLLLLLGTVILVALPEQKIAGLAQLIHKPSTVSGSEGGVVSTTTSVTSAATTTATPVSSPVPVAPVMLPPILESETPSPAITAAAATTPTASAASTITGTGVANGLIRFKAKGSVWIQVVDAKGKTQLSKALTTGEIATASGTTPLAVIVGRVDAVDVEVRGTPFNLTPVAKENIAKFEVK